MTEPERIADGRYIVVDGRRWRATDPAIPGPLRTELVAELMAARRQVGAGRRDDDRDVEASARRRVADAKLALGERGAPWWDGTDDEAVRARTQAAIRTLLRHRCATSSICPSEVARVVDGSNWRERRNVVREVALALAASGQVDITRGDATVESFAGGPVRLRRGSGFPDPPDGGIDAACTSR